MEKIEFIAKKDYKNLNSCLMDMGISNRSFKKYYFTENIFVDGKYVRHRENIKEGSEIRIRLEDEKLPPFIETKKAKMLYEDNLIMAVYKEAGILTHESKNFSGVTLRDKVSKLFYEKGINRPVRFINRLDMDTSGIILIAKNDIAQGYFQKEIKNNNLIREYIAVIDGNLEKKITVDKNIDYDDEISIKRKTTDEGGLPAKTIFNPLYNFDGGAIIKCRIISGRTHQIRVHLLHLGYGIIGDRLYGNGSNLIDRQALHSYRTRGRGINGEEFDIVSPLPEDIKRLLEEIRRKK